MRIRLRSWFPELAGELFQVMASGCCRVGFETVA